MAIPQKIESLPTPATIEDVLIKGDLSQLTAGQRTEYYMRVCASLGLNPMTQPFAFITLNGKLVLYALRACADQLRKINGISIQIVSQDMRDGLLSVHVKATDKTGRSDEDLGVVSVGHLKGEAAANGILKAVTKAKRRVTLSISGLGYLDETEIADIPETAKVPPKVVEPIQPKQVEAPHDPQTGEVGPHKIEAPVNGDGAVNWIAYGSLMVAAVKEATTKDEIDLWLELNNDSLATMEKDAPKVHKRLMSAVGK